jgi:antitoxin VapB
MASQSLKARSSSVITVASKDPIELPISPIGTVKRLSTISLDRLRSPFMALGSTMLCAKLFRNGRSQAVRLPATCRFEGTEVEVKRDPETCIVSLHPLRSSPLEWLRQRSELLDSGSDASAGFGELFEVGDPDAPAQQRDWP